jgi:agmatine deiminase
MMKLFYATIFLFLTVKFFGQDVYFPPEFEKQEGLLLTWDYNDSRNPITAAIAKAVQPSAKVWVIYYPGTAPMDTAEIRNYLRDHGVPDENVFLIPGWTETLWIRDYGPFTGYDLESPVQRLFLDAGYSNYGRPKDDSIPTQIANYMGIEVNDFPLQFEGGNVLTDGLGRGWGSTRIFSQNPGLTPGEVKATMETYLGLDDMMFLEALTHSGGGIWCHVDMFMKILDSETIMISEYPDFVPDYGLIESFVDTLSKMSNANGREYKIVRIPAPPKADGSWATTQNDEMRTYTNSIIINDVVVVPAYNLPDYDSIAKQVYEAVMPGYRIEMVDAAPLTPLYGALHCICKEVTKPRYLRINHAKITGMQSYTDPFVVEAEIFADDPVDSAFLFFRRNNQADFEKATLAGFENNYVAALNDINLNDTIHYCLEAWLDNDRVTFPPQGPEGAFVFWFDPAVSVGEVLVDREVIRIFPNPTNGFLNISAHFTKYPVDFEIQNMIGEKVYQGVIVSELQSYDFSGFLHKGIYTITLKNEDARVLKFIVQ